jgi:hypothetical protein
MARYPSCIFCGRTDSEPDAEDVLAKWIARQFSEGARSKFLVRTGYDLENPERRFHTRGHLGLVTHKPCRRCNNGWMSDLENSVKPIFEPMMRGLRKTLTTDEQRTIARWLLKTTINYEFARERSPRYFKPRDRKAFFESRFIPADTFVYIGRFKGTHALWVTDEDITLTLSPGTPRAEPMHGYTATFVIGQIALQVLSLQRPKDFRGAFSLQIPGQWNTAQFHIWPAARECEWPPEFAFDDDGIELFARRWETVTPESRPVTPS